MSTRSAIASTLYALGTLAVVAAAPACSSANASDEDSNATENAISGGERECTPTQLIACKQGAQLLKTTFVLLSDAPCMSERLSGPSEGCSRGDRECFLKCETKIEEGTRKALDETLKGADCTNDAEFLRAKMAYEIFIRNAKGEY